VNFIKSFARYLVGLRGGGVFERQTMRSIRLSDVDGRAALFGGAQLDIGIHGHVGRTILLAAR